MMRRITGFTWFWFALMVLSAGVIVYSMIARPDSGGDNEPYRFQAEGQKLHLSAEISPFRPGLNEFDVAVWLPEQVKAPEDVKLTLRDLDEQDGKDIAVGIKPIQDAEDKDKNKYPGYRLYMYRAESDGLSSKGKWKLSIAVKDADGNPVVYGRELELK